jgi:cellulose synthase/poly-beta-1,6-N-acetylglucosamine synthase-like glycosyltransferase
MGAVGFSLYQAAITLAGYARPRRAVASGLAEPDTTFGIVICARNEAPVIGNLLRDIVTQDYPADRIHVTVVAHNCTDATASIAECAGARVVVLDDTRVGKVGPLRAAVESLPYADYVGVLDADARIPADYLRSVAESADGRPALQVETVPAKAQNELEAAYGFGRASRNALWWRPRSRLGLGTTLTGSGFFIRPELIRDVLPELRSGTDDLEMTTRLAINGITVSFVDSTRAAVEEPAALGPSINQRSRWVRGHMGTIWRTWPRLALRAAKGDPRALDLALFVLVPTRVLTRTGVTAALMIRFLAPGTSIAASPILLAAAAETVIPVAVCAKAGILKFDRDGVRVAIEHGVLGFLWFPIGAWSLLTARRRSWGAIPRQATHPGAES